MTIPPRVGRWEVDADGRVTLVASHCPNCGENLFPERRACSRCAHQPLEEIRAGGPATLLSYTLVSHVPTGFTAPLAVGYGILPGDLVVLAPIDGDPQDLHKGMRLDLVEGVTSVAADGTPFKSYRYRMVANGDNAEAQG